MIRPPILCDMLRKIRGSKGIGIDKTKESVDSNMTNLENVQSGVHGFTNKWNYVWPKEEAVLQNLETFRGYKLGFMMHWSPATQLGIVESWALSDGDGDWARNDIDWVEDIEIFKQQYWDAAYTFNPVRFNPQSWAKLASECGFKYLLFTTKHHDGFCMWDTKTTDYKITSPNVPFHSSPNADIVRSLYDAFREEGLAISTYFSKPDWRSDHYWAPEFGNSPTRNVNYDVNEHPELWEKFVNYTHDQFRELTSDYGRIDCLWLDGGWVRPNNRNQDIRLDKIIDEIRQTTQPHLLVADRTVGGEFENILTPEQSIPEEKIEVPWETCMTLGRSFSFSFNDIYKTTQTVIGNFIDIISKGGSLALNITPQPDGALPQQGVHILRQLGLWVSHNQAGIYNSTISPCKADNNVRYTRRDGKDYAFYHYPSYPNLPTKLWINPEREIKSVKHLRTGVDVKFEHISDSKAFLVTKNISLLGGEYAEVFEISYL